MNRFSASLRSYLDGFLSLAYPNVCPGCGKTLTGHEHILCRRCTNNLPRTNFEWSNENPAFQSFWGRAPIQMAASAYYYRKGELLPRLIHQLKYKNRKDVGLFLGRLTGRLIKASPLFSTLHVVVPVPLHPRKLRIRGYNQCNLLAEGISEETGLPINSDTLVRDVYNPSQTRKGRFERWENVAGIFRVINPDAFENQHILLVDDVITTGATLEACCLPILQIPGSSISIITIGYAVV